MKETFDTLKPSPTQAPLAHIARLLVTYAKTLIEEGEDFAPCIHALGKDQDNPDKQADVIISLAEIMQPPWLMWKDSIIRHTLSDIECTAYCMATESWSLSDDDALEYERSGMRGSLEDHPNRISCITITGENQYGDRFLGVWEIKEGKRRSLDIDRPTAMLLVRENDKDVQLIGRMTGLLPPREGPKIS